MSSEILKLAYGIALWQMEQELREKTSEIFKWTDSRAHESGFMSRNIEFYSVVIGKKIVEVKFGSSIIIRGNYADSCRELEAEIREFFEQLPLETILDHMRFRMLIHQEEELDAWLAGRKAVLARAAKKQEA